MGSISASFGGKGSEMNSYELKYLMHLKKEPLGFHLLRENGTPEYVLIHFISPITIFLGSWIKTQPNSIIIYSPGHYQEYKTGHTYLLNDYIHFNVEDENKFKQYGIPLNQILYPRISDEITYTIELLEWNFISKPNNYINTINELMDSLLSGIKASIMKPQEYKRERQINQRSRFEQLRDDVYNDPFGWTVEKMAGKVWYSRSRFSIVYKKLFGCTPKEDIMTASLEKAKSLLCSTDMLISDISFTCGFNSTEYFIRMFKSREGMTPGHYRRLRQ